jgi:exosortase A-associated hydrolase 1
MSGVDHVHPFRDAAVAPGVAERPLQFDCAGERLLGVLAEPQARRAESCGVLILVGGPQYRAGSHRQFVLLARRLAAEGVASLRFDYRGMGDSSGEARDFRAVDADIDAALTAFAQAAPHVARVVLLGLCDAASAALMHEARAAHDTHDARAAGLVLLNPWVRDEVSFARVQVRHYYTARLRDATFWRKFMRGGVDGRAALRGFAERLHTAWRGRTSNDAPASAFQDEMAEGLRRFAGPVLLILSGNDLTAREFRDYTAQSPRWRGLLDAPRITRVDIDDADHTFSCAAWTQRVEETVLDWLGSAMRAPSPSNLTIGETAHA